jgi:hypothetical protein
VSELLERVITAATLRVAIRSKIRNGTSRRRISLLINVYAPAGVRSDRDDGTGVQRLAVEVIPHQQRIAFLEALERLTDDPPVTETAASRLVG